MSDTLREKIKVAFLERGAFPSHEDCRVQECPYEVVGAVACEECLAKAILAAVAEEVATDSDLHEALLRVMRAAVRVQGGLSPDYWFIEPLERGRIVRRIKAAVQATLRTQAGIEAEEGR